MLRAVSVGQGDTEHSTVLHVPSAAAVVGGDVVYNGVHMMTAETDEQRREAWIASLDAVAALDPTIVVAGHKSVGAPDLPESIAASQQYLRDFSRIVNEGGSVEDIVSGDARTARRPGQPPRPCGTPPAPPSPSAADHDVTHRRRGQVA